MLQKTKGTRDYYDIEKVKLDLTFSILRKIAKQFGYEEITFPIIEYADLFLKSVGKETDIIAKEMFQFNDKKNRKLVLRPEGTSSVIRMVLENKLIEGIERKNFFYIGEMFRYERPQKGRQREFFQFGIESINESCMYKDSETIIFADKIMKQFEIKDYKIELNYLGNKQTREKYKKVLREYLTKYISKLSADSKRRYNTNILRILDSKDSKDIKILKNAPNILDYLNPEEKERFELIVQELKNNKIKININSKLVRGLDYYNNLVFEVNITDKLTKKDLTIIGGGRYDNLISTFDNKKDIPAIGFAIGIERLINISPLINRQKVKKDNLVVLSAKTLKEDKYLNLVANVLREDYDVRINFNTQRNLTKKISEAKKLGASTFVLINEKIENNKIEFIDLKNNKNKYKKIKF